MVTPRARSVGGIGTRGPGETQIETDRRLARDRISALKRKLAQRALQPLGDASRARAGASAVGGAGRLHQRGQVDAAQRAHRRRASACGDRLFHTLDPTTRVLRAGGRDYLLTDTVGFIRKLPHQLVEAFGATLEETRLRRSDPARGRRLGAGGGAAGDDPDAVEDVLLEIGADEAPQMLVLAKADQVDEAAPAASSSTGTPTRCSSRRVTGEGLEALIQRIEDEFARTLQDVELLIPYDEGGRLAELHELAGDLEREERPTGCG